jgi:hypothetical protein
LGYPALLVTPASQPLPGCATTAIARSALLGLLP